MWFLVASVTSNTRLNNVFPVRSSSVNENAHLGHLEHFDFNKVTPRYLCGFARL